jgi:hypothetical protein
MLGSSHGSCPTQNHGWGKYELTGTSTILFHPASSVCPTVAVLFSSAYIHLTWPSPLQFFSTAYNIFALANVRYNFFPFYIIIVSDIEAIRACHLFTLLYH